eukprot:6407493-Alexandrium_andersonii.AAC.1
MGSTFTFRSVTRVACGRGRRRRRVSGICAASARALGEGPPERKATRGHWPGRLVELLALAEAQGVRSGGADLPEDASTNTP